MKKHFLRILVVMLMACLGIGVLAACGDGGEETPANETYTVEFSFGDPSHAATGAQLPAKQTEKKVGDAVALTTPAAAEEWKFDGWYAVSGKVDGATYTVKAADAVDGTITLTAHWAADAPATQVTVTYSLGACGSTVYAGETAVPGAVTVDAGTQVTLPDTPVWEGYDFLGWKVGNDATLKDAKAQITVNESVTVTAQWEAVPPADTYTVTYELGDHAGTTVVPTQDPVTSGTEIDLPTVQAAKGYRFKDWRVKNGDVISGTKYNVTGNVTIVAEWEPITYTVKYALNKPQDAQGTLSPASIADGAIAFGTPLSLPADPSGLTNYTFTGWKTTGITDPVKNSGSTTVTLTEAMIPNSGTEITLTAQWEAVPPTPTTSIEGVWSGAEGFAGFTVTVDVQGDTAHVIILKNADDSNFVCMYLKFEKGQGGNFSLGGATLTVDGDGHLEYGMGIPGQSTTFTTQDPLPDALDLTGTKYAVQDVTAMNDVVEIGFGATPAIKHNGTAATGVKAIDVGGYKVFTGTVGSDAITVIAFKVDTAYYAAVLMGESNKDRFDLVDTAPTFSVRYEAGEAGSSATNMPDAVTQKFEVGATYTLSDKKPAWEGHKFLGWKASNGQAEGSPDGGNSDGNASADLYHEGGSYTFATPTNVTFTAQWEEDEPATPTLEGVWTFTGDDLPEGANTLKISIDLVEGQSFAGYAVVDMTTGSDKTAVHMVTAVKLTEAEGVYSGEQGDFTLSVKLGADNKLEATIGGTNASTSAWESLSGTLTMSSDTYYTDETVSGWEINFSAKTLKVNGTSKDVTFTSVADYIVIEIKDADPEEEVAAIVVYKVGEEYYTFIGDDEVKLTTTPPAPQPTYTVQFAAGDHGSLEGGETSFPGKEAGATVTPPAVTADTGYEFAGWYKGNDKVVDPDQNYLVSANDAEGETITLTAHFTPKKYQVTLEAGDNGTLSDGTIEATYDAPLDLTGKTPTANKGYTFKGWFTAATGGTEFESGSTTWTIDEESPTLYAQYDEITYTVKFDVTTNAAGGSVTGDYSNAEITITNRGVEFPTGLELTGYTLTGWKLGGEGDTRTGTYEVTEGELPENGDEPELTFVAQWEPKTYTVTLVVGTGTLPGENTVEATYNATLTLPAVTANKGYIFDGWYTTASGDSTKFESGSTTWTIDEESPTLYARYNYIEYTVEYAEGEKGSGTVTGMPTATAQKVSLKEGNTGITLPTSDPALEGFTFEGWSLNGKNIGKAGATYTITDADLPANPENPEDAKITLTALWKEEGKVLVTYQLGDHAASNATLPKDSENVTKNGTFTLPTDTETLKGATGYEFDGWYIGDRKLGATEQVEEADITVTAKFKAITYTVEFAKGEGEVEGTIDSVTVTIEANHNTVALSDKKEGYKRTDHRFAGWKFNDTHTYEPEGTFTLTTDIIEALEGKTTITLTAQWNKVTYTVTYNYGEGANVDPAQKTEQVAWGETVTLETPTAKPGYTFDKWEVTGVEGYDNGDSFEMPKNAVTVTATWNKTEYTVTYNYGNGTEQTEPKTAQYEWGTEVTLETPTAKPGYTFDKWEVTEGGVELQDGNKFTMPKNAVTVTATWNKTEYTVTFEVGAGTAEGQTSYEKQTVESEAITPPSVTAKAGYKFTGWQVKGKEKAVSGTYTVDPADAVEGTITIEAKYEPIEYTVKFSFGEASHAASEEKLPGEITGQTVESVEITLTQPKAEEGWAFDGWYTKSGDVAGTYKVNPADADGENTITITARWVEEYTVEFYDGEEGEGTLLKSLTYAKDSQIGNDKENAGYADLAATQKGHEITGWYYLSGEDHEAVEEGFVPSDHAEQHKVKLYATWKHNYVQGKCSHCQDVCKHENVQDGECKDCGAKFTAYSDEKVYTDNFGKWGGVLTDYTITEGEHIVLNATYADSDKDKYAEFHGIVVRVAQGDTEMYFIRPSGDSASMPIVDGSWGASYGETKMTQPGYHNEADYIELKKTGKTQIEVVFENDTLTVTYRLYNADGSLNPAAPYTMTWTITNMTAETYKIGFGGDNSTPDENGAKITYYKWYWESEHVCDYTGHDHHCTICGEVDPEKDSHHDYTAYGHLCTICGKEDPEKESHHSYDPSSGKCTLCGKHEHSYEHGECKYCGSVQSDNYVNSGFTAGSGYEYSSPNAADFNLTSPNQEAPETPGQDELPTISRGQTIVVIGQHKAEHLSGEDGQNWFALLWELSEGFTGRADSYGWSFTATTFSPWSDQDGGQSGGTSLQAVDANGNAVEGDVWAAYKLIAAECNYRVEIKYTSDKLVEVKISMTATAGEKIGCTYSYTANIVIVAESAPASLSLHLGGEKISKLTVAAYQIF